MRVTSLKKMHLRRTICKGGIYHEATINMFSPINDAEKPLGQ